jgi:CheY-like chemotaxis protein
MRHQILLVHEEQATRDGLVAALDNEGFIGIPVVSGQQALAYLQSGGKVSVILLDERAGWTAFRRAQQNDPALAPIPVIAITPLQGSSRLAAARVPIDIGLLITIVRRLCSASPDSDCSKAGTHQRESRQVRIRVQVA